MRAYVSHLRQRHGIIAWVDSTVAPPGCQVCRSVTRNMLRGSDGPDRACLARLGSACDCVCLECVCVGRSPLKDRLHSSVARRRRGLVCAVGISGSGRPESRLSTRTGKWWKVADPTTLQHARCHRGRGGLVHALCKCNPSVPAMQQCVESYASGSAHAPGRWQRLVCGYHTLRWKAIFPCWRQPPLG